MVASTSKKATADERRWTPMNAGTIGVHRRGDPSERVGAAVASAFFSL
jgi:hypothetical protein